MGQSSQARDHLLDALTAVAEGGHPYIAKPLAGLGPGVLELALRHRGMRFAWFTRCGSVQTFG
jgi:phage-related protein